MATVITTPGAADANSYCSRTDADTYLREYRIHSEVWVSTSGSNKDKCLMWATDTLDKMINWNGRKSTQEQALRWPRAYVYDRDGYSLPSDDIPAFLRNATAEFAMHLIAEDRTLETNRDLIGFSKMTVETIEMEIDKFAKKPVIPDSVWILISGYGVRYGKGKTLERM